MLSDTVGLIGLWIYVGATMAWAGSISPGARKLQDRLVQAHGPVIMIIWWSIASMLYIMIWPILLPKLAYELMKVWSR